MKVPVQSRWAAVGVIAGILLAIGAWRIASGGAPLNAVSARSSVEGQKLPVIASLQPAGLQAGLAADKYLDKTPPREAVGLRLIRNGWTYSCMECHKLIPAKWHYDRPVNEHRDVQLEHGNNRFCLNCHHPTNRNAFVDYDGSEIAEADVVLLCGKCHGTIYRDWKAGVHGRENGFWNPDRGQKSKLRCIQCHDPHSPRFKAMQPLPPLRYPPRGANPPKAGAVPAALHD